MRKFYLWKRLSKTFLYSVSIGLGTLQAQNSWQLMNGSLTSFAKKPGSPTLFAGDGNGLIRKSNDKGLTWQFAHRVGVGITHIGFVDAQKGFATTSQAGLFLKTEDGGATWQRIQIIDPNRPDEANRFKPGKRVVVVDPMTIFFDVYNHPISNPSAAETIVTRDGGVTFEVAYAPGNLYHVAGDTLVAFGKETDIYGLSYLTIFKSTDKGKSWAKVVRSPAGLATTNMNNNGINLAYFFSSKEFYMTANKELASDHRLYKTVDGGLNFTVANKPNNSKVSFIHFKDKQNGVLLLSQSASTFTTTNGGTTWTQATKEYGDLPVGYLGGDTLIANLNGRTTLSVDYGKTWNSQSDLLNSVTHTASPSLYFMQTVTSDVAFASIAGVSAGVSYGGNLVKTNNGGITWQNVKDAANTQYTGSSFAFSSPDTFLLFKPKPAGWYEFQVHKTTDGGKTTTATAQTMTFGDVNAVAKIKYIDKKHAVAYAKGGSLNLYLSSDYGNTWAAAPVPIPAISGLITDVSFPSLNAWYVVMGGTKVYKSTNQGANWTDVTGLILFQCSVGGAGQGVYFTDDLNGYVYGCEGNIYQTSNGAASWTKLKETLPASLQYNVFGSMEFRNATEGYLASINSSEFVAQTLDNGTWTLSSQLPGGTMRIDFSTPEAGGALVSGGYYYKYFGNTTFPTEIVEAKIVVTSLESAEWNSSTVKFYPNPTESRFRVQAPHQQACQLVLSTLQGREIYKKSVEIGEEIDVTSLPKGVYMATLHTQGTSYTQKLVIK